MTGREHINNYMSPGGLVAALANGCRLETTIEDEDGLSVYLEPGDEICSGCSELIPAKSFSPAPYGRVLSRMKNKYGRTYCPECHEPGTNTG